MEGVLISVFGSKYYGWFAWNLILSIRATNTVSICLVADEKSLSGLNEWQKSFVDYLVKIDTPKQPAEVKLNLQKYTPFKKTMYIDADSLVFGKLPEIKESFYCENQGLGRKGELFPEMQWADMNLIHEHFGLDDSILIPAINSSFMVWDETQNKIFETAYELFISRPYDTRTSPQKWGRKMNQPDELYLNVSLAIHGTQLKKETPIYFPVIGERSIQLKELKEMNKSILSFAGDGMNVISHGKNLYDSLMNQFSKQLGTNHPYKIGVLLAEKFTKRN